MRAHSCGLLRGLMLTCLHLFVICEPGSRLVRAMPSGTSAAWPVRAPIGGVAGHAAGEIYPKYLL